MKFKKYLAEKAAELLKKPDFAESFLHIVLFTVFLLLMASVLIIFVYKQGGNIELINIAFELITSAVATLSIGFGGYYCFKHMPKK